MNTVLDMNIDTLIENVTKIIAPVWPLKTFIARNPLQGLEGMNFQDAILIREKFLIDSSCEIDGEIGDINRELIKWCQVFLDEGQATIPMPEREKGFYRAFSLLAPFDKKLNAFQKREWLLSLPVNPDESIFSSLKMLQIPEGELEDFLQHTLVELPGWAGYIKWRSEWQNHRECIKNPITLKDFLAVRLVITSVFLGQERKSCFKMKKTFTKKIHSELIKEVVVKEEKYLKEILKKLTPQVAKLKTKKETTSRPDAQLVFCIDVRSEQFRMRLEKEGNYETLGFAGFFGLPVTIDNYNTGLSKDCCPVLIKPRYNIYEEPASEDLHRVSHFQLGKKIFETIRKFYQDLKYNFATPFALVETLGVWCGVWMAIRTFMPTSSLKLRKETKEWVRPNIATTPMINIPISDQVIHAESVLKTMGLIKNFSQLVMFCGHRGATENNPYASALDCGACGGNHGGLNAKILASILNNTLVRGALLKRGIEIPNDTLFVGAEHNTTTDEIVIDNTLRNDSHKEILQKLKIDIAKAGVANSKYRCQMFGLDKSENDAKKHVLKRSSDWAEVRSEWGLARNAAFIIGPRSITKDLDLDGRCFLHSYEWEEDVNAKSLETILTGPMVVAEWINTQYFFSTLNNLIYGSGSKITQNITGKLGVMQGNGSDLMDGLPLQSVNSTDDKHYHDPMRLQTIVYAPCATIDSIIQRQPILKKLFFNEWVILVAIDPKDGKSYRLIREREWVEIIYQTDVNLTYNINIKNKINTRPYNNKSCVIASMHSKENAISSAFSGFLGLNLVQANIDTDQLGTFTGEIERKGSALDCVRKKCELGLKERDFNIGIASEGSFTPHPAIPFMASDYEILYFIDKERDFHIYETLISTKTNYFMESISNHQRLKMFCHRALFPSHGLIVRPNKCEDKTIIFKGIQRMDVLEEVFFKCCRVSLDGKALVETDMRAHMNPTRMEVIKELANSFAKRIATPCPLCNNPGWGMVEIQKGLECELCGSETDMIRCEVFGCPKCAYKEYRSRQDGLIQAQPQYCGFCNP